MRFFLPNADWDPNDLDIYVPWCELDAFVRGLTDPVGLGFKQVPPDVPVRNVRGQITDASDVVDEDSLDPVSPSVDHDGSTIPAILDDTGVGADGDNEDGSGGECRVDDDTSHADTCHSDRDDPADEDPFENEVDEHLPSAHDGLCDVKQFYLPQRPDVRVDVITSISDNPVYSLKRFWSPIVMNFLRPDACVCGVPLDTLDARGTFASKVPVRNRKAIAKYEARGFVLRPRKVDWEKEISESAFFGNPRPLVYSFKPGLAATLPRLPIRRTERGWIMSSSWPLDPGTYARWMWPEKTRLLAAVPLHQTFARHPTQLFRTGESSLAEFEHDCENGCLV